MTIFLLKLTLLLLIALCVLPLMRRSTAAVRHLVCAMAFGGALLLPVTLLWLPRSMALRIPVVFTATATSFSHTAQHPFPPLFALWGCGAAVMLVRLGLGYWRVSRILRTARRTEDEGRVFVANVSVPIACGLLPPSILLPRESESWPLNQRSAALRHERGHIARRDLWTSLLAHLTCAVYWFHPLVWAVARQLRHEQEIACDDAVLAAGFDPAHYAEALVATAQHVTATSLIGCHMLNSPTLHSRIARLLDGSLPRATSTASFRRTAILAAAVFTVIGLTHAAPQSQPDGIYRVGHGVSAPAVLLKADPAYTDQARDAKIEGTVLLRVVIGADGQARDAVVVKRLDPALDSNAITSVYQWRFRPGLKDGQPVAVRAQIEINYRLK